MEYKKKEIVSTRQLYRRVATGIRDTWKDIQQEKQIRQKIQIDLKKEKSEHDIHVKNDNIGINNSLIQNVYAVNVNNDDIRGITNIDETYDCINQSFSDKNDFSDDNELSNSLVHESVVENISEDNVEENLSFHLRNWAVQHKTPQIALNHLLQILRPFHSNLPLDSRTLLNTNLHMPSKQLKNGELCYIGLRQLLKQFVSRCTPLQLRNNEVNISFNIDRLPLFKSSNTQLWPILGLIKNCPEEKPFVIAIYCGNSKPSSLNIFLEDFINELSQLLQEGFLFENKLYTVKVHSFICDAPAKAYIKCTKSHNGYSSCDKCFEAGEYVQRRIIYRSVTAQRRTDSNFRLFIDEDHHTSVSPLSTLPIDLVKTFPIDYMHAVCLGVMKKFLNTWISGDLKIRLSGQLINVLSERLMSYRSYIVIEFNRKPRSLAELARWKATELRMFLLYLGPLGLKGILPNALYENFLLFHCSIVLLCSKKHIDKLGVQLAGELLVMFIKHCEKIYGSHFLIYNVHILCHLNDDVEKFGPLDNYSAFPFENYLQTLKKLVRSPHKPLQQIIRRLKEIDCNQNVLHQETQDVPLLLLEHNSGPFPANDIFQYKMYRKIKYKNVIFYVWQYCNADCYCYTKEGKVIKIHNILFRCHDNILLFYGKQFLSYVSYYEYPYDSEILDIFRIKDVSNEFVTVPFEDVIAKCLLLPDENNSWISFPLIHSVE